MSDKQPNGDVQGEPEEKGLTLNGGKPKPAGTVTPPKVDSNHPPKNPITHEPTKPAK